MSDPTKENRSNHADTIIRNHVIWSMGAGLIPVLVADIFAVSALQLDMIRQMCRVYDVNFSETQGKAIVTSLTSSTLARIGAGSLGKTNSRHRFYYRRCNGLRFRRCFYLCTRRGI